MMAGGEQPWERPLRLVLILAGLGWFVLALGYFRQWDWATSTWPWPDGRLSYTFVASILAAMAVAAIWLGIAGALAGLAAGALNICVMAGGFAAYFLKRAIEDGDDRLAIYGAASALVALTAAAATWWAHRLPMDDRQRVPPVLRGAFVAFWAILVAVGLALLLVADIMPWPLRDDTAALFGWIFLSDSFYFAYAVARPYWTLSAPQLWSFLVYDLVLIVPFIRHFNDVPSDLAVNLWVYTGVLVVSGTLSAWFIVVGFRRGTLRLRAWSTGLAQAPDSTRS